MTKHQLKFFKKLHVSLWDWIVKHPSGGKGDWPGWIFVPEVASRCFLCFVSDNGCKSCPGNYGDPELGCLGGLWNMYTAARQRRDWGTVRDVAIHIRDLKWVGVDF